MDRWLHRLESARRAGEHPAVHVCRRHYSQGVPMNGTRFVIAFVLLALLAAGFIILGIPEFGT